MPISSSFTDLVAVDPASSRPGDDNLSNIAALSETRELSGPLAAGDESIGF
jgi:hypothetical protein